MMVRSTAFALVCSMVLNVALAGCDDAADPAMETPRGHDSAFPSPPLVDGAAPPTDAATPGDDAAPPEPDADTRPLCGDTTHCADGLICVDGRCTEPAPCDDETPCPEGQRCEMGGCVDDGPMDGGPVVFDPALLGFNFNQAGQTFVRGCLAGPAGEAPVTITALRIDGSPTFAFEEMPALPAVVGPNAPVAISVRYTADDAMVDVAELVAVTAGGESRLPLRTSIKPATQEAPCLQTAPRQLVFGGVQRGQSITRDFTLTSCANVPVTVTEIRRGRTIFGETPATFQLANPPGFPLVLQPAQSQDITVEYSPRRAGIELGFWEVLSDDAQEPAQRVDMTAIAEPPDLEDVALHVRLRWNTDETDVDLHLVRPNGQLWTCEGDCYFASAAPNWGDPNRFEDDPFLDVDNVDGFGPENINLEAPAAGTYHIYVHYWANHGGNEPAAEVDILQFGQVVASYGPQQFGNVDEVWDVATIDFPNARITAIDQFGQQPRGRVCGGF